MQALKENRLEAYVLYRANILISWYIVGEYFTNKAQSLNNKMCHK